MTTMTSPRRFQIRTGFKNEVRQGEIRARKVGDAWEVQAYLLLRPGADPLLAHEEKMGTSVCFHLATAEQALDEMMRHLKMYFQLEIEEPAATRI